MSILNEIDDLFQALLQETKKYQNYIFPISRIFSGKFASITLLGFECTINPQNLIKIVGAIFEKINFFNFFFLYELPLVLRADRKRKSKLEIFARRHQISNVNEIGQLVQALCQARDRKLKTIFLVSAIFPGKIDSVILLDFECSINQQILIKIVRAIFEKIEILNFFLCELLLILWLGGKLKKGLEIFARGLQISNLNEIDQLVYALRQATERK